MELVLVHFWLTMCAFHDVEKDCPGQILLFSRQLLLSTRLPPHTEQPSVLCWHCGGVAHRDPDVYFRSRRQRQAQIPRRLVALAGASVVTLFPRFVFFVFIVASSQAHHRVASSQAQRPLDVGVVHAPPRARGVVGNRVTEQPRLGFDV